MSVPNAEFKSSYLAPSQMNGLSLGGLRSFGTDLRAYLRITLPPDRRAFKRDGAWSAPGPP